jgi:hypothetical protein
MIKMPVSRRYRLRVSGDHRQRRGQDKKTNAMQTTWQDDMATGDRISTPAQGAVAPGK